MQDLELKWEKIIEKLRMRISTFSYDVWFKQFEPIELDNEKIIILTHSSSAKTQILRNYIDKVNDCVFEVLGENLEIVLLDPKEKEEYIEQHKVKEETIVKKEEKNPFNEKYTFDNFVVGKSNQFVYAAARTVAEHPGQRYNPLFIYGGVGLGKTHLLHAIGNFLLESNKDLKIMYVTCEQFMNDYVESLASPTKNKATMEFRGKYRKLDVLMVDDIQFISNKTGTQEEFFHTFNDLYQAHKQIIISSDKPPKEIETLEERLKSRFASGLIHDIQSPDLETRIAILRKKSQQENYMIEDEAINFIAEKTDTNIRELEGKLSQVYFLATLAGKKTAGIEEAKEIFDGQEEQIKDELTPEIIIDKVCNYFGASKADVLGKKKSKDIVEPRMISIYLISDILDLPLKSIGKIFGGRDHTTIMHSRNKITEEYKNNKKTQNIINEIKELLKSG
ncbi:MAG: chromosomal replication initiator protein DnaA [Clostridia bacterium]|nr:chromosomal replication initiator protein DnaA [Clostridia bacterium]